MAFEPEEHLMKALVYNGPMDVQVKSVPDAKIERHTDVLVEITSSNICGISWPACAVHKRECRIHCD